MIDLSGKVIIVTGAARGIGEAHVRSIVESGGQVLATDVLVSEGQDVVEPLGQFARFMKHDVTLANDWTDVVAAAIDEFGRIDGLVNNAGVLHIANFEDETIKNFDQLIRINLFGTFLGVQAVIPAMREIGGGSIVNMSSIAGTTGFPGHAAYCSSKWAIRGLTRVGAIELGPDRIRVNAVLPGGVDTEMLLADYRVASDEAFSHFPAQRLAAPKEIAELVVYLLSDSSSFVTGSDFVIDGGHASTLAGIKTGKI